MSRSGSGGVEDDEPRRLRIVSESDTAHAGRVGRRLMARLGFSAPETESVVLAIRELAANLVRYARDGEIVLRPLTEPTRVGVQVESHDRGPGIPDLTLAMRDGFSTGGGLGSGLPAVRRLMDDFSIETGPGGTHVLARKWRSSR